MNEKIDVYSFGVILLELTAGKEATKGDEHSSLAEWAWRQFLLGSNVEEALDEDIMEACYLDEMCNVFKLGLMCTDTLPSNRPSMREVLEMLLEGSEPYGFTTKRVKTHYEAVPLLKDSKNDI